MLVMVLRITAWIRRVQTVAANWLILLHSMGGNYQGYSDIIASTMGANNIHFGPSVLRAPAEQTKVATVGPSVLRAPAEQTKVATVLGN